MNRQANFWVLNAVIIVGFIILSGLAIGATQKAEVQDEIVNLIAILEKSGCTFNRNGTWYDGKEAVAHINRKYQYLLNKGLVSTTESFIELAASKSSMSGRPYLVRCGSQPPVHSRAWFTAVLEKMRKKLPLNSQVS